MWSPPSRAFQNIIYLKNKLKIKCSAGKFNKIYKFLFNEILLAIISSGLSKKKYSFTLPDRSVKGIWWMPWFCMAMKDVVSERYDLGSPLTASIQIFPNEETLLRLYSITLALMQ